MRRSDPQDGIDNRDYVLRRRSVPVNTSMRRTRSGICLWSEIHMYRSPRQLRTSPYERDTERCRPNTAYDNDDLASIRTRAAERGRRWSGAAAALEFRGAAAGSGTECGAGSSVMLVCRTHGISCGQALPMRIEIGVIAVRSGHRPPRETAPGHPRRQSVAVKHLLGDPGQKNGLPTPY